MKPGERFAVTLSVGEGFGGDEEGVRADDPREGAAAWDLDDVRQAGLPRRDQRIERDPLGLFSNRSRRTIHTPPKQRVTPLLLLFRQGFRAEAVPPVRPEEFAQKPGTFFRTNFGTV